MTVIFIILCLFSEKIDASMKFANRSDSLEIIRSIDCHPFINNRVSFFMYFRRLLSQRQLVSFLVCEVQLQVLRQDLQD